MSSFLTFHSIAIVGTAKRNLLTAIVCLLRAAWSKKFTLVRLQSRLCLIWWLIKRTPRDVSLSKKWICSEKKIHGCPVSISFVHMRDKSMTWTYPHALEHYLRRCVQQVENATSWFISGRDSKSSWCLVLQGQVSRFGCQNSFLDFAHRSHIKSHTATPWLKHLRPGPIKLCCPRAYPWMDADIFWASCKRNRWC